MGGRRYLWAYGNAISLRLSDYGAGIPVDFHDLLIGSLRVRYQFLSGGFCLAEGLEKRTTGGVVGPALEVILFNQIVNEGIV